MQIFTESSSDLWKKFSAPEFSFQKTFIYPIFETFYALGCRADCNDAIEKIYRLKKREKNKCFFATAQCIKSFGWIDKCFLEGKFGSRKFFPQIRRRFGKYLHS